MTKKNKDLHGNVRDHSPVALLLIDVINDLNFKGNAGLLRCAPRLGESILRLKKRAKGREDSCRLRER